MLLQLILALLLGLLAGTFTGLLPGIHINLVASLLVLNIDRFGSIEPITLAAFIVSMSITHTFLDFLPSIYLGAPEEDSFLSILPGHRLLMKGLAHEAFILTLYGSITAIPIILLLSPIFINFLPFIYNLIKTIIPFILIFISLFIILREKNITISALIFVLSCLL